MFPNGRSFEYVVNKDSDQLRAGPKTIYDSAFECPRPPACLSGEIIDVTSATTIELPAADIPGIASMPCVVRQIMAATTSPRGWPSRSPLMTRPSESCKPPVWCPSITT